MMKHAKQWLGLLGVLVVLGCTAPEMLAQALGAPEDAVSASNGVVGQDVGAPSDEVARWKELEAHLSRLESRLEDYRRSQDGALAGMDATWTNRLRAVEADIDAYFKKTKEKEVKAIRQHSQTALARVLEEAQTKHDNDAKELRQYVEGWRTKALLCCIFAFFVIIIVVLSPLWYLAWKHKALEYNTRYCLEMVLWGTILVLVSFGAFHLVSRIVDGGTNGGALQNISSPHGSKAVLQAYEQLSAELGNWGALLGVIGAFFGLVLPVGAYLMQIKAVNQEEEKIMARVNEFIQKARDDVSEKMEALVDAKKQNLENGLQQTWEEMSDLQMNNHRDWHQALRQHEVCREEVSLEETWMWARWITSLLCVLQTLTRVRNDEFVKAKLISLIEEIKEINQRAKEFEPMQKEYKMRFENCTIQLKGDANKLRECCKKEMDELVRLLSNFGVSFI